MEKLEREVSKVDSVVGSQGRGKRRRKTDAGSRKRTSLN